MSYRAPLNDIRFALNQIAGLPELVNPGKIADLDADLVNAVLDEAGKFAEERIAPLNRPGDERGAVLKDSEVTFPDGWKDVYDDWVEGGWCALPGPKDFGGQHLPVSVSMACVEIWNSACMSFALNPLLTQAAVNALNKFGSDELKATYLEKMVQGQWTGTMQLTEPQAGSDLNALKARAVPRDDGTYRLHGTKIFISYGEHALTENIIHMVLARTPDAPAGTRGISLFLAPKFLLDENGNPGPRNDIICSKLEHKLGIHASPTCVLNFGENDGAVGWLVGEENRGLQAMFTMMNEARLAVGIQGVAIAERATQQAIAYANERRQGRSEDAGAQDMVPIVDHPDIRRSLLTMRSKTAAARAICYVTASALDHSRYAEEAQARQAAAHKTSLLTPVAKAFSTDIGVEVASDNIQVHGGMGYMEETGAAQLLRDARIAPIYEGTNGIQAIDLAVRKLPLEQGRIVSEFLSELSQIVDEVKTTNRPEFGNMGENLREALELLETATRWMLDKLPGSADLALAAATPYLRLFGLASGGILMAQGVLNATREEGSGNQNLVHLARYFAEHVVPDSRGLVRKITDGSEIVLAEQGKDLVRETV
ncbi:MAG: acyl-CoA dehydrogenase [Methyloligellaceae bacterium]